jgi:hypothetical protein
MSVSASLEKAPRSIATLRRMAARVRARTLASVLWRVAAILFALQLVYVVAANSLLRSRVIKDAISGSEGFNLDYSSAYSLWLGSVSVRDLTLRVEDYNVQFEVALTSADVDISLSQLLFKKFHVTKLDAAGTRFRMRHKLITVGDGAERVAAYPPIEGFADPPYYVGLRPAPIPDDEYDLWSVRIENVHARVSELWVMEHRFRGEGLARGSFVVKPARWVQVMPASLVLQSGTLTLGEHVVAQNVSGKISCSIPDMDVQKSEGLKVLNDISASVKLALGGGQLSFLRAYVGTSPVEYGGEAEWLVDVNVQRGNIERGSRLSARAMPLRAKTSFAELSGDVMLSFGRDALEAPDELALSLSAPSIAVARKGRTAPAPQLRGVAGSLRLSGTDLKQELALGEASFAVASASVPDLGWFEVEGSSLAGEANATLQVSRARDGAISGSARLGGTALDLRRRDLAIGANAAAALAFTRPPDERAAFELQRLRFDLSDVRVQRGAARGDPFSLSLDGAGMRVVPVGNPRVNGMVRLEVSSTEALLPLLMADPWKDLAGTALALEHLEAKASVAFADGDFDLKLMDARSGNVRMRGYLSKHAQQPLGAFLLSSGPINVGVTLSQGDTEISPFVGDEWLATAWPKLVGASRKPG